MNKVSQLKFDGFRTPKYTQVPDQLFDELLAELLGTELKALLYIMRRTFGFKKDADAISLSQMLRGITTKNGSVLDRGAGLSKPTLLKALRSLQEKNIIRTERRRSRVLAPLGRAQRVIHSHRELRLWRVDDWTSYRAVSHGPVEFPSRRLPTT